MEHLPATGLNGHLRSTAIFIQDRCLQHLYIRSNDISAIVERPERLRAINVGISAALARVEDAINHADDPDGLVAALGRINLASDPIQSLQSPVSIVKSNATVDVLNNPAVKFIHGDIDGDVYLETLIKWTKESTEKISKGESEIPSHLPQGDLYVCPESLDAIQCALGTTCEAIDIVMNQSSGNKTKRAFAAIRPPGHHCGEDTPCGFCFVNNVAVGAAHAHLKHKVNRVVILDMDLHHGNGTQSIAWQINEETYRNSLEEESAENEFKPKGPGLKVYYGSIHDILSFPCEDGKADLVQAASVSVHGPHGQHIENVHLEQYSSEAHFWDTLYAEKYSRLLKKATEFIEGSGGAGDDVLVFISAGFDANEHEHSYMSRHGRKVPVTFFHRFTADVCAFADRYARGRVVSVLEGGYSDRALISGMMAHLCGLIESDLKGGKTIIDESWWNVENLEKIEKATRKRTHGTGKQSVSPSLWLDRTTSIFSSLDSGSAKYLVQPIVSPAASPMTLRDRKKASPSTVTVSSGRTVSPSAKLVAQLEAEPETDRKMKMKAEEEPMVMPKKLPRVILHVRAPPGHPEYEDALR